MSQFDKLLMRIRLIDKNLRFEELKKVLESYGYTVRGSGSGGSHMTFRKPGTPPITIPIHAPIKTIYVLMVKEIVEGDEQNEKND